MISSKFCESFKNTFFTEHLWTPDAGFLNLSYCFFATQWTNKNQVISIFEYVLSRLSNVMDIMNGYLACLQLCRFF